MFENRFYTGVVESRADPLKIGRCKVRVVGIHTENTALLPTKDLPWAIPLQPITSASVSGIGHSPTGPVEGTLVMVFFRDEGSWQEPVMMGTIAGIPESKEQSLKDPYQGTVSGVYAGVKDAVEYEDEAQQGTSENGSQESTSSVAENPFGTADDNILRQVEGSTRETAIENVSQKPVGTITTRSLGPSDTITESDGVKGASYGSFGLESYSKDGVPVSNRVASAPVKGFVDQYYPDDFRGLTPSSEAFDSKWKEVAAKSPLEFQDNQRAYASQTKYTPALNFLRAEGIDLTDRSPAVQEVVFSASVHGETEQVHKALGGKNLAEMTDADIIQAVQQARAESIKNLDATEEERRLEQKRLDDETSSLLNLAEGESVLTREELEAAKKKGGTISSAGVAVPRTIPENTKSGFSDPFGLYPRKNWLNEADVSRLARGERKEQTILAAKERTLIRGVGTANGGSWSEPKSAYNAQYPLNHVWQTESGHVQEFDDTPEAERIHIYHRKGSFVEFHPDGSVVFKSVKDHYSVTVRDQNVYVGGSCNVTVMGDANIHSKGALTLQSDGDMTIKTGSNLYIGAEGKAEIVSNGDLHLGSNGNLHEGARNVMMNCSWYPQNVTVADVAVGKIEVATYDDDENVPTVAPLEEEDAINEAYNDGSIAPQVERPKRGANGQMVSSTTKPNNEIAMLEPSKVTDQKEVRCHGDDTMGSDFLSTNYRVADLTTSPVLTKVSMQAQAGLTKCEVFENLSQLAKNVMEPLRARFGNNFIITSAFRKPSGNGRSQHIKGQAVDIQFPRLPADQYVHRIEEISKILPTFDQMILEYHGRNPVIHISFNVNHNRREKKSTPNLRQYFTGFRDRAMGLVYN